MWNDPQGRKAGKRPSYCMVNVGFWGKEKGQLHRFFPWRQVSIPMNQPLNLRAANQVIDQKEQFIAIYEQVLSRSLDTTAFESELSDLEAEINIAAELIEECIKENAHVALDQDEYQKRYEGLVARFDKAKARHTEVTDLIAERMARKHQIETYLKNLRSREPLTEFRETDWLAMVDYITVHSKKDIRVTFKDGTEIKG